MDASRRDLFAAAALREWFTLQPVAVPTCPPPEGVLWCWSVADAMLAAPAAAAPNESRHGVFATTTNAPPAPAAEPRGYEVRYPLSDDTQLFKLEANAKFAASKCPGGAIVPLYAHPPAAPAGEAERLRTQLRMDRGILNSLIDTALNFKGSRGEEELIGHLFVSEARNWLASIDAALGAERKEAP